MGFERYAMCGCGRSARASLKAPPTGEWKAKKAAGEGNRSTIVAVHGAGVGADGGRPSGTPLELRRDRGLVPNAVRRLERNSTKWELTRVFLLLWERASPDDTKQLLYKLIGES
eukprot:scaffold5530_cov154-Pinguiococcus_pyrenoidosus.AAC.5